MTVWLFPGFSFTLVGGVDSFCWVCWLLVVFVGGIVVCTMGFMWWFLVGLVLCDFL